MSSTTDCVMSVYIILYHYLHMHTAPLSRKCFYPCIIQCIVVIRTYRFALFIDIVTLCLSIVLFQVPVYIKSVYAVICHFVVVFAFVLARSQAAVHCVC